MIDSVPQLIHGAASAATLPPPPVLTPTFPKVMPDRQMPERRLALNVIVQRGVFGDTAAGLEQIARDVWVAQQIFDTNTARFGCPRIVFDFDMRRDILEAAGPQSTADSIVEVFLVLARMGGWQRQKNGLPALNIYYMQGLPDRPGRITTGGHIPGSSTACNQSIVVGMQKLLRNLGQVLQNGDGSITYSDLQDYMDLSNQIMHRPSIYLDIQRRRESTLAHEIAHLLGLQHVPDRSNLMFPASNLRTGFNFTQEQCRCLADGVDQYSSGRFPFNR